MGFFTKLEKPIFLKETSNAELQLEGLKNIEPILNEEGKLILEQDIKNLEYGIAGEKNIAFELKNSFLPIYILHDIYLENGDVSAQIDYIVVTRKLIFIIECKNLYGNIEINSNGDFIRTMEYGRRTKKEGIYSPITQNKRHLELIKSLKVDNRLHSLEKFFTNSTFETLYKSVVILANQKTIVNAKFAKKEIKQQVIRADQLVGYIKEMNDKSKERELTDKEMLEYAKTYLNLHKEIEKEYTGKYEAYLNSQEKLNNEQLIQSIPVAEEVSKKVDVTPVEELRVYKELKEYRLLKSREEKIKPYFLYNDNQLRELVQKMPNSKEKLLEVNGFGVAKVNKYGDDIIRIVKAFGFHTVR